MPLLINEVHDDLVFDAPKKDLKANMRLIKDCMEKCTTLRKLIPEFDIPLRVSQSAGSHWGVTE
jgi:DNA polymerase I-like protein with 3'-5' exonuclease and polymerase domains